VVVRAGWYGREGQRRQRWKCTPATGEVHRFAEVLPRIVSGAAEHVCPDCATALEPWEGQPAPRLYGFSAREVAAALVMVAGGASYRQTAEAIRVRAGRALATAPRRSPSKKKRRKGRVLQPANRHPQLVSDWVEVFAPIIWAAYAPTAWPASVAIDECEFRYSRPGKPRGDKAFSVLAAVGYEAAGRPYVAAIEAVPAGDIPTWERLLSSLHGRPGWVVGDGGAPLKAATTTWMGAEQEIATDAATDTASAAASEIVVNLGEDPGQDVAAEPVLLWRCEWHLARPLTQALPTAVTRDRTDRIHGLVTDAVRSLAGWDKLLKELTKRSRHEDGYQAAIRVMLNIRPVVAAQDGQPIAGPRSTGAVEEFFRQLENTIGDRASRMTNKTRTDALLKLIAARRNGWADETTWAELIRDHLTHAHGRAPDQRRHVDRKSEPSLRPTPR
jgi:hypothetical protein